ncbi:efflux RND transporter permease subunit [Acinetobacter baumannii]
MKIVVPLALAMIFILLMAVFHNVKESLLVFSGVPFALSGGLTAIFQPIARWQLFFCECCS